MLSFLMASSQIIMTPRPVASRRPRDPPMSIGLPVTTAGHRLPHVHGVGVHHPCHGLLVGVDVGRGNVFFRADEFDQLGGVAAGHALQFAARHLLGIADDAALGAAKGNIDHGAFPGHPTGQRAHFVQRHVRRIAHAALGRAARNGMLHPVAGKTSSCPLSMATGMWTMISRLGWRSTRHRPSSSFSFSAARSNRAACCSQGLLSCSSMCAVAIDSPK